MILALARAFLFVMAALFMGLTVVTIAGCATEPEIRTQIVFKPVEVKVAVREKCQASLPPAPIWYTETKEAQVASWFDQSKFALSELEQSRAYVKALIAELSKCI